MPSQKGNTMTATTIETTEATETTQKERFAIDTPEKADWALGLLADIEGREARARAQFAKMIAQFETDRNSWHARFAAELENFTRQELERTKGKRKSLTLFNGTVAFRTSPSRLVIESEADAIQTARLVLPEAVSVETVERVDKKALLAHVQQTLEATGELLPGFACTEEREDFAIKLPKKDAPDSE